jgi:hypothetical protein
MKSSTSYIKASPPSKKSIFVRNFETEINA